MKSIIIFIATCLCYEENGIYAVAPVKMSESPASKTAIVEHRYNFPHAVPNSIYGKVSIIVYPPKPRYGFFVG